MLDIVQTLENDEALTRIIEMDRAGLLESVLPEIRDCKGCLQNKYHNLDVWQHTLAVIKHLEHVLGHIETFYPNFTEQLGKYLTPRQKARLKLAALFHDTGKPATRTVDADGTIRFYGHSEESARIFEKRADKFLLTDC